MTGNDYQHLAWETAKSFYKAETDDSTFQQLQITTMTLALAGESGELANKVKKIIENGGGIDHHAKDIIIDELGDVLWYSASLASLIGINLEDVFGQNISKLRQRYPNGMHNKK